ncbi:zinc finger protein 665 [Pseudorasbora parva]|uniref:zinc finger protein 665 n=1 Tax=Pseudorasbora parva TaxID=51549 RepID=UPI00351DB127
MKRICNILSQMPTQMQVSLPNEGGMELQTGTSFAHSSKTSEGQWMDENQEFEEKQETSVKTQIEDKDVNVNVLQTENCNGKKRVCPVCHKRFGAPSKLKRHCLIHTDYRPFQCSMCCRAFRDFSHLKAHIRTHTKSVKWRTPSQSEDKDVNVNVSQSVTENCNGKKRVCPVCHKCFGAPSKLKRHCLIHTDQRPFQCSICCHAFRDLSHLKTHIRTHTNPVKRRTRSLQSKRNNCVPCDQAPNSRLKHTVCNGLGATVKSYSPKQLTKCDTNSTDKLTSTAADLIETNLGATGVEISTNVSESGLKNKKGHWCPVCLKCFKAPSKLRRHIVIHTKQKPFKCLVCFKSFQQRHHLEGHKCNKESRPEFNSILSGMQVREKTIQHNAEGGVVTTTVDASSDIQGRCFEPGLRSLSPDVVIPAEKRIPPVSTSSDLVCPLQLKKKGGYQCKICLKIFSVPSKLARHLFIHLDVKPYTCTICKKSFKMACYLHRHLKIHTGKINNPSRFHGVPQKNWTKYSTLGALNGTNNCRPDGSNVFISQILDSVDAKKNEMLECKRKLNQNVPMTDSKSSTVEIESLDTLINTEVQAAPSSPTYLKRQRKGVHQCCICQKIFPYPSKLTRHILSHTDFRPFRCHMCPKSFRELSHLQCHQKIHKKKGQDIIAGRLEKEHMVSFGNIAISKDQDVPISSRDEDFASAHQDQNMVTYNMSSQTMNGNGNSLLENVQIKSEFVFQCKNKSIWDLTHKTDISVLVEEKASDIVPFGRVSDCPPKTDSSVFRYATESRTEGARHMDDIEDKCVSESYVPYLHEYCQKPDLPRLKEEVVVGHLDIQDPGKRFTDPPHDLPICPGCCQCFPTLTELNAHKCANGDPKEKIKNQCDICFKVFNAPSKLKRHSVTHTSLRQFQCTQCQKTYTQPHHLKTHMLSHS